MQNFKRNVCKKHTDAHAQKSASSEKVLVMIESALLLFTLDMTLAFWYSATRFSKKFLWRKA